jgi:uncharacterized protein
MIDDVFVFDGVAHVFNFEPKNAFGKPGEMFSNHLYAFHTTLTPSGETVLPPEEFLKQWTVPDIRQMVYDESDTDMLVAMPLPLTDLYHDGLSPWEACADLASRDPDRTVFWGSVNPLEGRKALDLMERQVGEFGAKAFKFYNVRYDYGSPYPWRMDDPRVAFPVFEKAQELGVNLIGVHKGVPLGPQPIEHTQTWDMDGAAANFPDINFIIYHVGLPFLDETCWQLIRYPNLYASLAATIKLGGADLPSAVGAARVHGLRDPRRSVRGLRLPTAHRPGEAEDPRREPATPTRDGRRSGPRPSLIDRRGSGDHTRGVAMPVLGHRDSHRDRPTSSSFG